MSKVGSWNTNAGSNNSAPPDGWPENQAPSTVNDCAREMMASIRTVFNDVQYFDGNNTPSYLTSTTFSLGTADTTNFHIGRRIKLFDSSTLYGTIANVSSTTVTVRLDSGALTASLSSCALAVIGNQRSSLPSGAYRNKNYIVNPILDFWQRSATFEFDSVTSGGWTADMFYYKQSAGAAVRVTRSEYSADSGNVPTVAQAGMRINNSWKIVVTSADAALGATEYAELRLPVEGYEWRNLAGKPTNLGFWVKVSTNATGVYCCALRSRSFSASCVMPYTLSAADTWTRISLPFPAEPDGTATWNYKNGTGVWVSFTLAAGTGLQGTDSTWTSVNTLANSDQANFLSVVSNTFQLTPVQFQEGQQFTELVVESFPQEKARVERYCEKSYLTDIGPGTASQSYGMAVALIGGTEIEYVNLGEYINFSVPKPGTATVAIFSPQTGAQNRAYTTVHGDRTAVADAPGEKGFSWFIGVTATSTLHVRFHWLAEYNLD